MGDFKRLYIAAVVLPILAAAIPAPAWAEPVARSAPAAGAVIARKAGEEVRFIDLSNWQVVDLKQDLLTGDVLRTNATGQLAIVFSDRTQVRLGRNSSLVVKQMTAGTSADTILERSTVRVFNTAGDVIEQGKYVVVWRKVGDQWFMAWDIWNADAPPPAPAPATP